MARIGTWSLFTPPKLPKVHITKAFTDSGEEKYCNTFTIALEKLPSIIPTISNETLSLTFSETARTRNRTNMDPTIPASVIAKLPYVKNHPNKALPDKTISETPKLAPLVIPKIKGPARGFLNKVCINIPAIPNPAPAIKAVRALGSLSSLVIKLNAALSSESKNNILMICFIGISVFPMKMSRINKQITAIPVISRKIICPFRLLFNFSKII